VTLDITHTCFGVTTISIITLHTANSRDSESEAGEQKDEEPKCHRWTDVAGGDHGDGR
jgi:hypothetical protein